MTSAKYVAITGMTLDVLGAVILARSFFMKRPSDVFRELKSFGSWDFHITRGARDLLLSWLVQSYEARTGAVIIGIGFFLQAISQILPHITLTKTIASLGIVVVAGTALYLFFLLQAWFVQLSAKQARGFYDELEPEATGEDWKKAIPDRRKELYQIEKRPDKWLNHTLDSVEGMDSTLTSNE